MVFVAGLLVTGLVVSSGGLLALTGTTAEQTADKSTDTAEQIDTNDEEITFEANQTHANDGADIKTATVVTEEGEVSIEEALTDADNDTREAVVIESSTVGEENRTTVHTLDDEMAEAVWSTVLNGDSEKDREGLMATSDAIRALTSENATVAAGENDEATVTTEHGTEVTVEQITIDRNEQNGEKSATGQNATAEVTQENEQFTEQRTTVSVDSEQAAVLVVQLNVQSNNQNGTVAAAGENASALVEQTNEQRATQTANINVTAEDATVVVTQLNVQINDQQAMVAAAGPNATADSLQENDQYSNQTVDVVTSTDDTTVYVTQENLQISEQTDDTLSSDEASSANEDGNGDESSNDCNKKKKAKKKMK